jgi:hypothetical protein
VVDLRASNCSLLNINSLEPSPFPLLQLREGETKASRHPTLILSAPLCLRWLVGHRRGRGATRSACGVYTPFLCLGLGRLGVRLPMAMMALRSCYLIFTSGCGVGSYAKLGDVVRVFFCFFHGESKVGGGFGAQYVRIVFIPLLVIGVVLPFGGFELRVVGDAGDCGCLYWAGILGSGGVSLQLVFPL